MINHTVKLIGKLLNNKIFRVSLLLLILTYPFYSEFRFYLATGDSMLPTYENGELVVIYRTKALGEDWRPARGQVIIAGDEEDGRTTPFAACTSAISSNSFLLNNPSLARPFIRSK